MTIFGTNFADSVLIAYDASGRCLLHVMAQSTAAHWPIPDLHGWDPRVYLNLFGRNYLREPTSSASSVIWSININQSYESDFNVMRRLLVRRSPYLRGDIHYALRLLVKSGEDHIFSRHDELHQRMVVGSSEKGELPPLSFMSTLAC